MPSRRRLAASAVVVVLVVAASRAPSTAQARRPIALADLDPTAADDKRLGPHNDALADRRPELYGGPDDGLDDGLDDAATGSPSGTRLRSAAC